MLKKCVYSLHALGTKVINFVIIWTFKFFGPFLADVLCRFLGLPRLPIALSRVALRSLPLKVIVQHSRLLPRHQQLVWAALRLRRALATLVLLPDGAVPAEKAGWRWGHSSPYPGPIFLISSSRLILSGSLCGLLRGEMSWYQDTVLSTWKGWYCLRCSGSSRRCPPEKVTF